MQLPWVLFEIIINMVQCASIAYFGVKVFPPKRQYPHTKRYILPLWVLDSMLLTIISLCPTIPSGIGVIVSFAIANFFAHIFRDRSFPVKFFWLVAYFVLLGGITLLIRSIALSMEGVTYEFLTSNTRGRIIYVLIANIVFLSTMLLLVRIAQRIAGESIDFRITLVSCGLISASLFVLFILLEISAATSDQASIGMALTLAAIAMLVVNILVLLLFHLTNKQNEKVLTLQKEKQRTELQLKNIRSSEQMQDEWRVWRHDIRSRLQALSFYADNKDYDSLVKYLHTIVTGADRLPVPIETGNKVFNIVINQKAALARLKGIRFETDIVLPAELMIGSDDLLVIIDNLLENAFEACERISGNAVKFVRIKSMMKQGYVSIAIENTMEAAPTKRGVFALTSKENNTEHGIGLHIIDKTVNRYGGFVERDAHEGIFSTNILIRNSGPEER